MYRMLVEWGWILIDEYYYPVYYQIEFGAENYSSGIYFMQMISGNFVQTQKLTIIK